MPLTRGNRRFYQLLLTLKTDDILTSRRLLAATGWDPSSLRTYVNKNKLSPFLVPLPNGDFKVMRAGRALAEQEVDRALTQVSPSILVLTEGQKLRGVKQDYRLVREIGRGAVGHVWEATARSGQTVAVKIMNPRPDLLEPTRIVNVRQRFRREIRNGDKLRHPHIVAQLDHGEYGTEPFLVMERAKRSWGDVLATEGALSRKTVTRVIQHALDGLAYLHAQECVHRDVKPSNLLVGSDETTIVGDLGIVSWSDLNSDFTSAGTITRASMQLGSWHYMAPEQLAVPHEATAASDLYSLGVTWFELLTGTVLTPQHFAAQRLPEIKSWSDARGWILRMTNFDPSVRPTTSELREAARDW